MVFVYTKVKCKDCKHLSACQIRESTEDPNAEIECSEYEEREGKPTIKRYWGDNPDEMTDDELICACITFDEGHDGDWSLYMRYYQEYLWGEIKRRGITDKQIEDAYGK